MRTTPSPTKERRKRGYALMIVLFFSGISLLALSGALQWTSNSARLNQRNSNYFNAAGAAEAATEKILTQVSRDYRNSGEGAVYNNLSTYRGIIPTASESSLWSQYQFSDAQGTTNATYIDRISAWAYVPLQSQYTGLYGLAATYRVISNARMLGLSNPPLIAGVKQDVQVASIPVFQFAIFYSIDLEINPGPVMNIQGRVHSNGNLYTQPQATLTYMGHVTCAGQIILGDSPLDPLVRTPGPVVFQGAHDSKVSALTLPIGTNNSPTAVRTLLDIPPAGELATSLVGQQRYYNKADLVILVSNLTVTAKSGSYNNFATPVLWPELSTFVKTNVTFYNKREGKTIKCTEIDIAKLKAWSAAATNTLHAGLTRDIEAIYVADMRTQTASTEPGVRVVNGQTLPSLGLTVASPDPVYIQGHFNAPSAALGTTNTSGTKPASIVADAITILSSAWADANAGSSVGSRNANDTTVNAAFLAGIVPSDGSNYSGGVENFPRFLEDWSGNIFTYNGSMVVMFYSQFATAPWGGSDVYNPPSRNWAFDLNFMDASKLPPGTPQLLTLIRGAWASVAHDSIQ